ncbi:MAG: hypothetical protein V4697_02730 [Patescibacteria group bacterium]
MQTRKEFPTDKFVYKYLAGPVETSEEIEVGVPEGNCRFALQLYFYRNHGIFFKKDQIYLPGGYKVLGKFIFQEESIDFDELKLGDVIYAQNLRNKEGEEVDKSLERYKDKDEWLYYLHSAIYLGKINDGTDNRYVWHATHIDGGPTLWTLEKFEHYYKPISAKRVL